jgi:hypothetical protein
MDVLLTILGAILFVLGWIAGKAALAIHWMWHAFGADWVWHAMKVGFVDARKPRKKKPPKS